MTIKIEIPSDKAHLSLALAIGEALVKYAGGSTAIASTIEIAAVLTEEAAPKSAETVTELASSTETSTLEAATVKTAPSEEAGNGIASGVETSEGAGNSQTKLTDASTGDAPLEVDEHGVAKNPTFCGNAAKPFNASGKKKGQWKKRQGVAEADYDTWYAEALAAVVADPVITEGGDNVTPIDTSNAFGGNQNQGQQQNNGQVVGQQQGGLTFKDAGDFMQWLSEQQAAENITSGDIDSAYAATCTSMGDLFDPSKSAGAIVEVYGFLSNLIGNQG